MNGSGLERGLSGFWWCHTSSHRHVASLSDPDVQVHLLNPVYGHQTLKTTHKGSTYHCWPGCLVAVSAPWSWQQSHGRTAEKPGPASWTPLDQTHTEAHTRQNYCKQIMCGSNKGSIDLPRCQHHTGLLWLTHIFSTLVNDLFILF